MDETGADGAPDPPGIEDADVCAACGEPIDRSSWHYVWYDPDAVESGDRDGAVLLCSLRCHDEWRARDER
ncbi:MAG: hypothetical protein ABEJ04_02085 [Halobacteriaceae archaeon]